jgi:hypothetical protein
MVYIVGFLCALVGFLIGAAIGHRMGHREGYELAKKVHGPQDKGDIYFMQDHKGGIQEIHEVERRIAGDCA